MAAPRRLHLNLNFLSAGSHAAAWLWPGNRPDAFVDPTYLVETARLAERGTFDAVFLADHPSMPARSDLRPFQALEPSIVLTAIAGATSGSRHSRRGRRSPSDRGLRTPAAKSVR